MRFIAPDALEEALGKIRHPAQAAIQVLAAISFVIGSAFFLPGMPPEIYVAGVNLFMVASIALFGLALHDLHEGLQTGRKAQRAIVSSYALGLSTYVIGTSFFYPNGGTDTSAMDIGAALFVVGSLILLVACVANVAYIGIKSARQAKSGEDRGATVATLLVHTTLVLLAMAAFLVGSVLYLSPIGCNVVTMAGGTWAYILGSVLNLLATVLQIRQRDAFRPWLRQRRSKWDAAIALIGKQKSGDAEVLELGGAGDEKPAESPRRPSQDGAAGGGPSSPMPMGTPHTQQQQARPPREEEKANKPPEEEKSWPSAPESPSGD